VALVATLLSILGAGLFGGAAGVGGTGGYDGDVEKELFCDAGMDGCVEVDAGRGAAGPYGGVMGAKGAEACGAVEEEGTHTVLSLGVCRDVGGMRPDVSSSSSSFSSSSSSSASSSSPVSSSTSSSSSSSCSTVEEEEEVEDTRPVLSFSGCGFLYPYQLGVAQYVSDHFHADGGRVRCAAHSAGFAAAFTVAAGVPLSAHWEALQRARRHWAGSCIPPLFGLT